ncbi:hypothetical protein [Halocatena marina]|uniref:Uncharacterized protein n=1 Tax=Halocatena marina TaxID=2934937 RepID=A0ABD5YUV6_9EURY|nr:hypothetical protein [Halocatena marina]
MTDRKRLTEEEALLFLSLLGKVTDDFGQAFQEASEGAFGEKAPHDSFGEKWGAPASQVYTEQTRRKYRRFVEHAYLTDVDDIDKRLAAIRAANRATESQNEDVDLEDALDGLIAAVRYTDDIDEVDLSRRIASCYQEVGKKAPKEHWEDPPACSICGAKRPRYYFGRMQVPDAESDGEYAEADRDGEGHEGVRWTGDHSEYTYWECAKCYAADEGDPNSESSPE